MTQERDIPREDAEGGQGVTGIPRAVADELGRRLSEMDERSMTDTERAVALIEAWELLSGRWIPWAGGPCPVPQDTLLDVRWNNGAVSRNFRVELSEGDLELWESRDKGGHIVAYRLAGEAETPTPSIPSEEE